VLLLNGSSITKAEKYSFPRKIKYKIMEGYYE